MRRRQLLLSALTVLIGGLLLAGCGSDSGSEPRKPFAPQATLTAVGGTARTDKPQFVIRVKARPGDVNIRSAAVTLPAVVLIDSAALGRICSRRELSASGCAGHKRMGMARVLSPLYKGPLSGPVYAVSGYGGLPHLAYLLQGPAAITLQGRIVTRGARIQAGIDHVPDTPLKIFEFKIRGGKPGYLVLSRNICRAHAVADAVFESQNGEIYRQRIPLQASCGG